MVYGKNVLHSQHKETIMRSLILSLGMTMFLLAPIGCEKSTVEGRNHQALTLNKPADLSIDRGSTATLTIRIQRQEIDDPVAVQISKLPDGVEVVDDNLQIEGDQATFTLNASQDADQVSNHVAQVTIEGPDGIRVTETFGLTVRGP
jgi:hypothetical protein